MVIPLILLVFQFYLIITACLIFHITFSIDFSVSVLPLDTSDQEILMLLEVSMTNRNAIWHLCFTTMGRLIAQTVTMEQRIANIHSSFQQHFLAYYRDLVETKGQTIGYHQLMIRFELALMS